MCPLELAERPQRAFARFVGVLPLPFRSVVSYSAIMTSHVSVHAVEEKAAKKPLVAQKRLASFAPSCRSLFGAVHVANTFSEISQRTRPTSSVRVSLTRDESIAARLPAHELTALSSSGFGGDISQEGRFGTDCRLLFSPIRPISGLPVAREEPQRLLAADFSEQNFGTIILPPGASCAAAKHYAVQAMLMDSSRRILLHVLPCRITPELSNARFPDFKIEVAA